MLHRIGRDPRGSEVVGNARGELDVGGLEWALGLGGAGVEQLEGSVDPLLESLRTDDLQGPGPLGELPVEDQPGQAGVVVAMQVAERDVADRRRIDRDALERDQRGRATVEQERRGTALEEQAGLEAPAARERVA